MTSPTTRSAAARHRAPATGAAVPAAHPRQRRDVQGLRALAVTAVALNHLCDWPSGGFVGVDVFFVISGFLITGLLLREHDRTGHISFVGFYVRRAKRILPAAVLTLLVTLVAGYLILPRTRFHDAFWDAVWSAGFVGNWRFVEQSTDYFQRGLLPSPLQHFWSLGVEEQFYLVWPWLMLLLLGVVGRRRAGRVTLAVVLAVAVAASFVWALHATSTDPGPAYFSTVTRAWELGVGAAVALVVERGRRLPATTGRVLAWAGLVVVVVSLFTVSDHGFPAPWAALPVLATAVVLAAGGGPGPWPLTNPVSGYVGDISYSLYLWHFPVIVLAAGVLAQGSGSYYLTCALLMPALAIASYHLVENPVRRSAWLTGGRQGRTRRALITGGALTVSAAAALLLAAVSGVPATDVAHSRTVAAGCFGARAVAGSPACTPDAHLPVEPPVDAAAADLKGAFACWVGQDAAMRACSYGSTRRDAVRVAVVGDSHAATLFGGLMPLLGRLNWRVDVYVGYGCQWETGSASGCAQLPQVRARLDRGHYGLILTTSDRQFQGGVAAVARLRAAWRPALASGSRIVVIGDNPAVPASTLQCLQRLTVDPRTCSTPRSAALARPDRQLQAARGVAGVGTVGVTGWYCRADGCPAVIGNAVVYRDSYGHATMTWMHTLAPYLARAITAEYARLR